MQPLFVIFFTCFHQPFPFQKTNSSLSAYFSTNKELWFFTLCSCHFFRDLSEKQVNSNSCHRDRYDRSFKEAYQQFPELDRRLGSQHDCCCLREEDDLYHGNKAHEYTSLIADRYRCSSTVHDQNRQKHFRESYRHGWCDGRSIRHLTNHEKRLEYVSEPCKDRSIFCDDHGRYTNS